LSIGWETAAQYVSLEVEHGVLVQPAELFRVSPDLLLGREIEEDEWLREATSVLADVPQKSRAPVLDSASGQRIDN